MVAIISGNDLGLANSSKNQIGNEGSSNLGRSRENVHVNARTGNLVIHGQDEILKTMGVDTGIIRTYNSLGQLSDDNRDNWRLSLDKKLTFSGSRNASNSSITRRNGDESDSVYRYVSTNYYETTDGQGANDILRYNGSVWIWSDGSPDVEEHYNTSGVLVETHDQDDNVTRYGYKTGSNNQLLLNRIDDASGQSIRLGYSGDNLSQIRTISEGKTQTQTLYGYDNSDRLTQVVVDLTPEDNALVGSATNPDGSYNSVDHETYVTTYTYDGSSNRVKSIVQSDGSEIHFEYVSGRVSKIWQDDPNAATTYAYSGSVTSVIDPTGAITKYTTDTKGQIVTIERPVTNGVTNNTSYTYTTDGDVKTVTQGGNTTTYIYYTSGVHDGALKQEQDSAGNTVTYTYTTNNQLATKTSYLTADPNPGNTLQEATDPVTTRYVYDNDGHLRFTISGEGSVAENVYFPNGDTKDGLLKYSRSFTVNQYPLTGLGASTALTQGKLEQWVDGKQGNTQRTDYDYDFRGNLSSTTTYAKVDNNGNGIKDGSESTIRYFYDQNGQLLQKIEPTEDGAATATILLTDPFPTDNSDLKTNNGGWSVTDEGNTSGPSAWSVLNGVVNQSSNIYTKDEPSSDIKKKGSFLEYNGGSEWTDYTASYVFETDDNDFVGLMFRMTDSNNYYRFSWDEQRSYRRIIKNTNGNFITLAEDNVAFKQNRPYQIDITVKGNQIIVNIDGAEIFNVFDNDGAIHEKGSIALYTWGSPRTTFKNIQVNSLGGGSGAGNVATFSYDGLGRLLTTLDAKDQPTQVQYFDSGQSVTTLLANNKRTTSTYNANGQLVKTVEGAKELWKQDFSSGLSGFAGNALTEVSDVTNKQYIEAVNGRLITRTQRSSIYKSYSISRQNRYNYSDQIIFRSEVTTNLHSGGRYLIIGADNDSGGILYRRHAAYFTGNVLNSHHYDATQGKLVKVFLGNIKNNTSYIVEVNTTTNGTQLYVYEKGNDRESGWQYFNRVTDWKYSRGRMWTYGAPSVTTNETYVDNITESKSLQSTTQYKYDKEGKLRYTIDPTGVINHNLFDQSDRVIATIDGNGSVTESIYDSNNKILKTIAYAKNLSTARLNEFEVLDVNGFVLNNKLTDAIRNEISTAENQINHFVYDKAGRLQYTMDADAAVTKTIYNGVNQIIETISYAGIFVSQQNLLAFNLSGNTFDLNQIETIANEVKIDYLDRHTRNYYDNNGNLIGVLNAEGYLTEYRYTANNLLQETIQYFNKVNKFEPIEISGVAQRTVWDLNSIKADIVIDSANDIHSYHIYNGRGQQVGHVNGEGYLTESRYDKVGNLSDSIRYSKKVIYAANAKIEQLIPATLAIANGQSIKNQVTSHEYNKINQRIRTTVHDGDVNTVTGIVTDFEYNSVGNLINQTQYDINDTALADARGQIHRYDVQGRLTGSLTAEGKVKLVERLDANPNASTEDIWEQHSIQHDYDTADRRIRTRDQWGNVSIFYYNKDNQLRYSINGNGEIYENHYNDLGQVDFQVRYHNTIYHTAISEAQRTSLVGGLSNSLIDSIIGDLADTTKDSKAQNEYSLRGNVKTIIDAENFRSEYRYNAFGTMMFQRTQTGDVGAGSSVLTDNIGKPNSISSRSDYFKYNRLGQQTSQTRDYDVGGQFVTNSTKYDAFGRVSQTIDGNGKIYKTTHDKMGRVIETIAPGFTSANARRTSYDAFSRLLTEVDALQKETQYRYDDVARSVTIITPEGVSSTTTLNEHGETKRFEDGNGNIAEYTYDRNGNVLTVSEAFGTNQVRTTTNNYKNTTDGEFNRLYETTDAAGNVVRFQYDAANRLMQRIVDPGTAPTKLNIITEYRYDSAGRTIETKEAAGTSAERVTQQIFNRKGQLEETIVDPGVGKLNLSTRYNYDAQGNILSTEQLNISTIEQTTRYGYDKLGRRETETVEMGAGNADIVKQYIYDKNDNVVVSIDGNGNKTRYVYNQRDQLVVTVNPLGEVSSNYYDANGRLKYHNVFHQRINVPSESMQISQADVDALLGVAYASPGIGNSTSQLVVYDYNDDGQQISTNVIEEFNNGSTNNVVSKRTYDKAGNIIQNTILEDSVNQKSGNKDRETFHVYDALNREIYNINALGYVTETRYDEINNVLEVIRHAAPIELDVLRPKLLDTNLATQLRLDAVKDDLATPFIVNSVDINPNKQSSLTFHDDANRLIYTVDAEGSITKISYAKNGELDSQVRYSNRIDRSVVNVATITIAYLDDLIDKDASTQNQSTHYVYDEAGRQAFTIKVFDDIYTTTAMAYVTETNYNGGNQIESTKQYYDAISASSFSAGSVLTQANITSLLAARTNTTSHKDLVTQYQYDGNGRVIHKITAAGTTDQYQEDYYYDQNGNLLAETNGNGDTSYYRFDAANRQIRSINAEGYMVDYERDVYGNVVEQFTYMDQLTLPVTLNPNFADFNKVTDAGSVGFVTNSSDVSGDRHESFLYDVFGNQVAYLSPTIGTAKEGYKRVETEYKYDNFNNLVKTTQALNLDEERVIERRYNVLNQVTKEYQAYDATQSINDALYTVAYTEYQYDAFGNQVSIIDPRAQDAIQGNSDWAIEYRSTLTSANPVDILAQFTTKQEFDKLNRKTAAVLPTSDFVDATQDTGRIETQYDAFGNITVETDARANSKRYIYDNFNRVFRIQDAEGAVTELRRDVNGHVIKEVRYQDALIQKVTADTVFDLTKNETALRQANGYSYFGFVESAWGPIEEFDYDVWDYVYKFQGYNNIQIPTSQILNKFPGAEITAVDLNIDFDVEKIFKSESLSIYGWPNIYREHISFSGPISSDRLGPYGNIFEWNEWDIFGYSPWEESFRLDESSIVIDMVVSYMDEGVLKQQTISGFGEGGYGGYSSIIEIGPTAQISEFNEVFENGRRVQKLTVSNGYSTLYPIGTTSPLNQFDQIQVNVEYVNNEGLNKIYSDILLYSDIQNGFEIDIPLVNGEHVITVNNIDYKKIDKLRAQITNTEFDVNGRALSIEDAEGGKESYRYDNLGNVTRHTDKNGNTIISRYGALGNKIEELLPTNIDAESLYDLGSTASIPYDPKVEDSSGSFSRVFDIGDGKLLYTRRGAAWQYDLNSAKLSDPVSIGLYPDLKMGMTATADGDFVLANVVGTSVQFIRYDHNTGWGTLNTNSGIAAAQSIDLGTLPDGTIFMVVNTLDQLQTYTYDWENNLWTMTHSLALNLLDGRVAYQPTIHVRSDATVFITYGTYYANAQNWWEASELNVATYSLNQGLEKSFSTPADINLLLRKKRLQFTSSGETILNYYDTVGELQKQQFVVQNGVSSWQDAGKDYLHTINYSDFVINQKGEMLFTRSFSRGLFTNDGFLVEPSYDGIRVNHKHVMTETRYDALGNVIEVRMGAKYNSDGRFPVENWRRIENTYDKSNRLESAMLPPGNPITAEDAYYSRYNTRDIDNSVSIPTETNQYDALGNLITITGKNGFITRNEYDVNNRLIASKDAAGFLHEYSYDQAGNLFSQKDYNTPYQYANQELEDVLGNRFAISSVLNIHQQRLFDGRNQLVSEGAGDVSNVYRYQQSTDSYIYTQQQPTTLFSYDGNGNMVRVVDANGGITKLFYDKNNRKQQQIDAEYYQQAWQYDSYGNIVKHTRFANKIYEVNDPTEDRVIEYRYDQLNRVIGSRNKNIERVGDAVTRTYYDAMGNTVRTVDAENNDVLNQYDALNRLIESRGAQHTTKNYRYSRPTTINKYNIFGDLVEQQQGHYTSTVSQLKGQYIGEGFKVNEYTPYGQVDSVKAITTYTYDRNGWLSNESNEEGLDISYFYDIAGNIVNKKEARTKSSGSIDYINTVYYYDGLNRQVLVSDPTAYTPVYNYIEYNGQGKIVQKGKYDFRQIEASGASGPLGNYKPHLSYFYDSAYRVNTLSSQSQEYYIYDDLGNLVKTNSDNGSARYYFYDAVGNAVKEVSSFQTDIKLESIADVRSGIDSANAAIRNKYSVRESYYNALNQLETIKEQPHDITSKIISDTAPDIINENYGSAYDLGQVIASTEKIFFIRENWEQKRNKIIGGAALENLLANAAKNDVLKDLSSTDLLGGVVLGAGEDIVKVFLSTSKSTSTALSLSGGLDIWKPIDILLGGGVATTNPTLVNYVTESGLVESADLVGKYVSDSVLKDIAKLAGILTETTGVGNIFEWGTKYEANATIVSPNMEEFTGLFGNIIIAYDTKIESPGRNGGVVNTGLKHINSFQVLRDSGLGNIGVRTLITSFENTKDVPDSQGPIYENSNHSNLVTIRRGSNQYEFSMPSYIHFKNQPDGRDGVYDMQLHYKVRDKNPDGSIPNPTADDVVDLTGFKNALQNKSIDGKSNYIWDWQKDTGLDSISAKEKIIEYYYTISKDGEDFSKARGIISNLIPDQDVNGEYLSEIDVQNIPLFHVFDSTKVIDATNSSQALTNAIRLDVSQKQQFNAFGEIAKEIKVDGETEVVRSFEYNKLGNLLKQIDPKINITKENGLVLKDVNPTTSYQYDRLGRLVSTTDANNNIKTWGKKSARQYYNGHLLHSVFAPENGFTLYGYDEIGNRTEKKDYVGYRKSFDNTYNTPYRTYQYDYDTQGRVVTIHHPGSVDNSIVERFEFDQTGNRIRHYNILGTDSNPIVARTDFDGRNRVEYYRDFEGDETIYKYEFLSDLNKFQVSNGQLIEKDGSFSAADSVLPGVTSGYRKTTTKRYFDNGVTNWDTHELIDDTDYFGKLQYHQDMGNRQFRYYYDYAGQLKYQIADTNAAGLDKTTSPTYRQLDTNDVINIRSAGLNIDVKTDQDFDSLVELHLNTLIRKTYKLDQFIKYDYYNNNLVKRITDYNKSGQGVDRRIGFTAYQYDNFGQVKHEEYGESLASKPSEWESLQSSDITYDKAGRVLEIKDNNRFTIQYEYDAVGNRRRVFADYEDGSDKSQEGGINSRIQDLWYVYDDQNRFTTTMGRLESSTGEIITNDKLLQLRGSSTPVETHNIVRGTGYDIEYNRINERTQLKYTADDQVTQFVETYHYDERGHLEWVLLNDAPAAYRNNDKAGRVKLYKEYAIPESQQQADQWHSTTFNINGVNTRYINTRVHAYEYDFNNRKIRDTDYTFNRNYKTIQESDEDGGTRTYADALNILNTTDFNYDAAGNLIEYKYVRTLDANDPEKIQQDQETQIMRYGYSLWDDYKQSTIKVTATSNLVEENEKWAPGYSNFSYNSSGQLLEVEDTGKHRRLEYNTNHTGQVARRTERNIDKSYDIKFNQFRYYYFQGKMVGEINDKHAKKTDYAGILADLDGSGSVDKDDLTLTAGRRDDIKTKIKPLASRVSPLSSADFDQNYQPVSPTFPALTPTMYTLQGEGSWEAIAATIWGDESLWYLLAEANLSISEAQLYTTGIRISIPNVITNIHNNADTFKPYNAGEAMGNTSPHLPDPPPPPGPDKCKQALIIVVVIAVSIWTGGLAAGAGWSAFAAGTAAGAAGSLAGQVTGNLINAQGYDGVDFGKVVEAGLIGGVAGWASEAVAGASASTGTANATASATTGGANVAAQGVTMNSWLAGITDAVVRETGRYLFHGQEEGYEFDVSGIAAAAISPFITSKFSTNVKAPSLSLSGFAGDAGRTLVKSVIVESVRAKNLTDYKPDWGMVAVDSLASAAGTALGELSVRSVRKDMAAREKLFRNQGIPYTVRTIQGIDVVTEEDGAVFGQMASAADGVGTVVRANNTKQGSSIPGGKFTDSDKSGPIEIFVPIAKSDIIVEPMGNLNSAGISLEADGWNIETGSESARDSVGVGDVLSRTKWVVGLGSLFYSKGLDGEGVNSPDLSVAQNAAMEGLSLSQRHEVLNDNKLEHIPPELRYLFGSVGRPITSPPVDLNTSRPNDQGLVRSDPYVFPVEGDILPPIPGSTDRSGDVGPPIYYNENKGGVGGVPDNIAQGFTKAEFAEFSEAARQLAKEAGLPKGQLAVQGSRAKGTARPLTDEKPSDIDIILRVDEKTFNEFAQARIHSVRSGTRLQKTLIKAAEKGQLSRFDISKDFNKQMFEILAPKSKFEIDFSIVKEGSKIDTPPFIDLGNF